MYVLWSILSICIHMELFNYHYVNRAVCSGVTVGPSPLLPEIFKGPNGFGPPLLRRLGTVLVKGIILNIILL